MIDAKIGSSARILSPCLICRVLLILSIEEVSKEIVMSWFIELLIGEMDVGLILILLLSEVIVILSVKLLPERLKLLI